MKCITLSPWSILQGDLFYKSNLSMQWKISVLLIGCSILCFVVLQQIWSNKNPSLELLSWEKFLENKELKIWSWIIEPSQTSAFSWKVFMLKSSYSSGVVCTKTPKSHYKGKRWHLITIKDDNWAIQQILRDYPLYTNDKSWAIQVLPFAWVSQAPKDLTPFLEISDIYWGATKKYWYLYSDIPVVKGELENYFPFQFLWIQAVDALVGYSSGYLVSFPFKFPVDDATFSYSIDPDFTDDYVDDRGGFRWKNFINGGIQYSKYLGDDKDRIYFRDVNQWNLTSHYAINRVKKAKDFCFYRNPNPNDRSEYQ